jgi:hypothetical protein
MRALVFLREMAQTPVCTGCLASDAQLVGDTAFYADVVTVHTEEMQHFD